MDLVYDLNLISTGLFAGLMMTLVFLLQRQWNQQDRATYATQFRQFLLVAKGHSLITVLTFASFVLPAILSFKSFQADETATGILYLASALVFFLGCFIVTIFLNLPIYNQVISWQNEADSVGWQNIRKKFLILNIIRFSSALTSLVLLTQAS